MNDLSVADVIKAVVCEDPETSKPESSGDVEIFTEESKSAAKESANKRIMTSTKLSSKLGSE